MHANKDISNSFITGSEKSELYLTREEILLGLVSRDQDNMIEPDSYRNKRELKCFSNLNKSDQDFFYYIIYKFK